MHLKGFLSSDTTDFDKRLDLWRVNDTINWISPVNKGMEDSYDRNIAWENGLKLTR